MLKGILAEIIEYKKEYVEERNRVLPLSEIEDMISETETSLDFRKAVSGSGCSLIAEVKEASPSKGKFISDFNDEEIARIYEENGVAAISVVTDEKYFLGSLERLTKIREITNLPLLRKDFIIDPYQIYESRYAGADAILLIAACLYDSEIRDYTDMAAELGMASLVEVHNRDEMERAANLGIEIIGINNRNLETFETNISTTADLAPHAPKGAMLVSESGIFTAEDVRKVYSMGVRAVLVGEALITSTNIAAKVKELAYAVNNNKNVPQSNHKRSENE